MQNDQRSGFTYYEGWELLSGMYILTDHGGMECQAKFELYNKQFKENSWSLWSRTNYANGVKAY